MENKLMLHCGGERATLEELESVPLPKMTKSYRPVAHRELADRVRTIAEDILDPLKFRNEEYGLAKEGQHMFGIMTFTNGSTKLGLTIGLGNSYDKTLRVKIAAGARVFVCDNLCFHGGITYTRKHTRNVWEDIEAAVADRILLSEQIFQEIVQDAEEMRRQGISDDDAYRVLGLLFGHGVVNTPQLNASLKGWREPTHREFKGRNRWSLYNAVTAALKTTQPKQVMEKHNELHRLLASA